MEPLKEAEALGALLDRLDALAEKASGGTWQADLNGLYVTTDECPLCTADYERKHGDGERVQLANAELIAELHNAWPTLSRALRELPAALDEISKRLLQSELMKDNPNGK